MPVSRRLAERVPRFLGFAAVGLTGLGVNQLVLWAGADGVGIYYLWAAVLATQVSSAWNFMLTESLVFRARPQGRGPRFAWFTLLNNVWMLARLPILWFLTDLMGVHYLISNALAIAMATLSRFFVADEWIWGPNQVRAAAEVTKPACWSYDIHGIITVRSERRLPELEGFLISDRVEVPDIEVVVRRDGFVRGNGRVTVEGVGDGVVYRESLRGRGFAVHMKFSDGRARITGSPLLGSSPHVLYTNAVEPLLRWMFVRKGYALVHGACLVVNGKGILITARTDTGKTTTCLKAMTNCDACFVSDDMVIVSADGHARSYPKPLTISAHTLSAVGAAPLRLRRRMWLHIQGRVHSRNGRKIGMLLTGLRFPVATLNAVLQMLVPPPKFFIEQLVPEARTVEGVQLSHVIVIERGDAEIEALDLTKASDVLYKNTEDAYGFPPYPFIAAVLHEEDALIEVDIHRAMLERVRTFKVTTPDRDWYRHLDGLTNGDHDDVVIDLETTVDVNVSPDQERDKIERLETMT